MADAPLAIVLEMIAVLFRSTYETGVNMLQLLGKLIGSLLLVSYLGGPGAFLLAGALFVGIIYFLSKFFFGSARKVMILLLVGLLVLFLLVLGMSAA